MSNKLAGREKNIVTVEITVDKEAVEKAYQQASQNVSKKVSVPGLRKLGQLIKITLLAMSGQSTMQQMHAIAHADVVMVAAVDVQTPGVNSLDVPEVDR